MERMFKERMQEKLDELKAAENVEPIRSDGAGAVIKGPRNVARDNQNPDLLVPPATDHGLIPNLKFSMSDTHMDMKPGGWSREVTKRELPVDDTLAIINMNLSPGVREMHTHLQSEWGLVLAGSTRITAVDERGRSFAADCKVGEGWLFPANIAHSLQGMEEGTEFLLIFDKGSYSETNTFSISEVFTHMPMDVLSANFGVDESVLSKIPSKEVFITDGGDPGPLESQKIESPYGEVPESFKHELFNVEPIVCDGGSVRILDHRNFPVCKSIAAALIEIEPGAMREIHWHSNADELQYYLQGEARMTVFQPGPKSRTFNFQAGDVGYVPVGNFHYVQNVGTEKVVFLEVFKSNHFADLSLAQWIAMTPKEVVKSILNVDDDFMDHIRKESCPVVRYKGYEFPSADNTPQNVKYFKNFDYKVKEPPCRAAEEH